MKIQMKAVFRRGWVQIFISVLVVHHCEHDHTLFFCYRIFAFSMGLHQIKARIGSLKKKLGKLQKTPQKPSIEADEFKGNGDIIWKISPQRYHPSFPTKYVSSCSEASLRIPQVCLSTASPDGSQFSPSTQHTAHLLESLMQSGR